MKKKELKKRIKELEGQLFEKTCNQVADAMRPALEAIGEMRRIKELNLIENGIDIDKGFKSGGIVSKSNDKTEHLTQTGKMPNCEYVIDTNAAKRFVDEINSIKLPKTEGPESESELKENEISLEVGKKYMTKNHEMVNCEAHVGDGVYQCKIAAGPLFYEANGTLKGNYPEWSITSEAKE